MAQEGIMGQRGEKRGRACTILITQYLPAYQVPTNPSAHLICTYIPSRYIPGYSSATPQQSRGWRAKTSIFGRDERERKERGGWPSVYYPKRQILTTPLSISTSLEHFSPSAPLFANASSYLEGSRKISAGTTQARPKCGGLFILLSSPFRHKKGSRREMKPRPSGQGVLSNPL